MTSARDLQGFKDALRKADPALYDPQRPSHSDATLDRFFRARSGDIPGAVKQFAETEAWRREHNVDELYRTFPEDEYHGAKAFYPRWTGHRDKSGHPIYVYRLASVGPIHGELKSIPPERRYQRIVTLYQYLMNFVLPLCTEVAQHYPPEGVAHPPNDTQRAAVTTPGPAAQTSPAIVSCTNIIDLSGFSLSMALSLRNHLQEASRLATANYPETLHHISIVNAPSFFPTIWGWVKSWFDPGTRAKIDILGKDPKQMGAELMKLMDEDAIPEQYGGKLKWTFEDEPDLDEQVQKVLGSRELPRAPAFFLEGKVVLGKDAAPGTRADGHNDAPQTTFEEAATAPLEVTTNAVVEEVGAQPLTDTKVAVQQQPLSGSDAPLVH
ncbi:CRAL/TRIO domain-containing protein [Cylindrobasidium torrendii FP15055 ss-10]|uniref:CRAL/TRIO domain-containing protein n=1 Tax=Cylindrobasidium torrendii FP15055 ss-10 TaxID=1314674 RepID=A0A0D7BMR7_9AGAR|nr:CRAL/TRIO domain-containing protein [Cylindrobasidium torrendii FP15055 ss-10]